MLYASLDLSAGYTNTLYAQSSSVIHIDTHSCDVLVQPASVLCLELGRDAVNAVNDIYSLDFLLCAHSLRAILYEMCHVCAALTHDLAVWPRAVFWVGRPISPLLPSKYRLSFGVVFLCMDHAGSMLTNLERD